MKLSLTIFGLIFLSLVAKAQPTLEVDESLRLLEGSYGFNFENETRIIELSTLDRTFVEFDENGNELGGGKLTFVRGVYYLDPEDVSTYSLLNGTLSFTVEEWLDDKVVIKVHLSDNESRVIDLLKL